MAKGSLSKLGANERLEEEEPGSEGDLSELGNDEKELREGTGGSSCDGGDVSGGVTMDRENDDLCVSAGRSGSFRRDGRIPVLSVMPLGRVCGRDPLEPLLFDWLETADFVLETGLGTGTSFMDTFRVRRFDRVASAFCCVL